MRYTTPVLEGNRLLYGGYRYWVIELGADGGFQGYRREERRDYVVFDRLYGGVLATVQEQQDGRYFVLIGLFPWASGVADSFEGIVAIVDKVADEAFLIWI